LIPQEVPKGQLGLLLATGNMKMIGRVALPSFVTGTREGALFERILVISEKKKQEAWKR
jgi:hypothetical protein